MNTLCVQGIRNTLLAQARLHCASGHCPNLRYSIRKRNGLDYMYVIRLNLSYTLYYLLGADVRLH